MNKALGLALFAAAAVVAACAGSKEQKEAKERNPGVCPNIVVLADAARQIVFAGDESLENVAYTAEIYDVELDCRYFGDKPIEASAKVDLAFGRGPKGEAKSHEFTYFIAVTRTNLEVIEKAEFIVPVTFDSEAGVELVEKEIEKIVIPRLDESVAGDNFEVVVGLSLTPQQAIFNRSGKSLKFPDLKK